MNWVNCMVNLRTEQIRCVLCNKQLDMTMQSNNELFICANCQAYFCPDCLEAIKNYRYCPAASLMGVDDHKPKFLKILPPKPVISTSQQVPYRAESKSVKIISEKKVKIIDQNEKDKAKSKKKK